AGVADLDTDVVALTFGHGEDVSTGGRGTRGDAAAQWCAAVAELGGGDAVRTVGEEDDDTVEGDVLRGVVERLHRDLQSRSGDLPRRASDALDRADPGQLNGEPGPEVSGLVQRDRNCRRHRLDGLRPALPERVGRTGARG